MHSGRNFPNRLLHASDIEYQKRGFIENNILKREKLVVLFTFLARSKYDLLISDFILITLVAFIDIHIVLDTYVR